MNRVHATIRSLGTAIHVPRLLSVLAIAAALIALPAVRPEDAGAAVRSQQDATSACHFIGGEVDYDFWFDNDGMEHFEMYCDLPWAMGATAFQCHNLLNSVVCVF